MNVTGESSALRSVLGRQDVFALAFGAMIGWGWVLLSGDWIRQAGSLGSIVAFLIGAVLVSFVGLAYAELTAALPRAGGAVGFTYRGLGIPGAWTCAWLLILAYIGVCAFEAVALSQVLHSLFPSLKVGYLYSVAGSPVHVSGIVVSVVCSLLLLAVNIVGLSSSAWLQTVSTFGLLIIGLLFFVGSNLNGSTTNLPPLFTGATGVMAVAIMTPFFYTGFDVIPQAAEEIKLPQREIGKLILFAVAMAAVWYAGIQWCVGLGLPESLRETSELPTASAAAAVYGFPLAGRILVVGGLLGILTSWNAFFVGATRLLFGLSQAGLAPEAFSRIHSRSGVPYLSIVFVSLCTLPAPLFGRQLLVWIADSCSFSLVAAYLLVAITFLRLRRLEPFLPRPFCVKHPGFVGVGAIVSSLFFLLLYLPGSPSALLWPQEWSILLGWLVLGAFFYQRSRQRMTAMNADERERRLFGSYARTSQLPNPLCELDPEQKQ
jgi:basic amino acid/polyamine antiporter, APA family